MWGLNEAWEKDRFSSIIWGILEEMSKKDHVTGVASNVNRSIPSPPCTPASSLGYPWVKGQGTPSTSATLPVSAERSPQAQDSTARPPLDFSLPSPWSLSFT